MIFKLHKLRIFNMIMYAGMNKEPLNWAKVLSLTI